MARIYQQFHDGESPRRTGGYAARPMTSEPGLGVVQNHGTPKLSLRRPFANLARSFHCSKITTWTYDHVFAWIFRTKDVKGNCIQNIIYLKKRFLYSGLFDPSEWLWSIHSLKSVWSRDIAESSPFWARVWSGRIRLSRIFRAPFANLSRFGVSCRENDDFENGIMQPWITKNVGNVGITEPIYPKRDWRMYTYVYVVFPQSGKLMCKNSQP